MARLVSFCRKPLSYVIIIIIIIIIIILNPPKNEGGKKLRRNTKKFEVKTLVRVVLRRKTVVQ